MSKGDANVTDLAEYRDRLAKLGDTLERVKVRGAKHHHLVRTAITTTGVLFTQSLCGYGIAPEERWTRIVGKDPCCMACQSLASRGRFVIRPYRPGKPL